MERKKVGIITYPRIEDGKGRFLQAYSLYSAILNLGYEPQIINYYPNEWVTKHSFFNKIINFIKNPNVWGYITAAKRKVVSYIQKKSADDSSRKYKEFISKKINYDYNEVVTKEELTKYECDAWVCGSDQIWNPYFSVGVDEVFYLQFVSENKRIAYAASMGTSDIKDEKYSKCVDWISNIRYISVREKETAEKLISEYGLNAKYVCDPTFLMQHDWWNEFAGKRIIEGKYLLLFLFDNNPLPRKIAEKIAKERNLKIVCISSDLRDQRKYFSPKGIGPSDFVALFKYADYVCTQSFHGTVLSLIFNRQFQVFDRSEKGELSGLILRIQSLLKTVGLESQIRANGDEIDGELYREINNYDSVNHILEKERLRGLDFLRNSLENVINS